MYAQDESGVRRTSGGDEFIVELEGTRSISGSVVDNLDGMAVYCNPVLIYMNEHVSHDMHVFSVGQFRRSACCMYNIMITVCACNRIDKRTHV